MKVGKASRAVYTKMIGGSELVAEVFRAGDDEDTGQRGTGK